MRRLGILLVVVAATVQPVFADDLTARQQDVRTQLTAASAQITQLNLQMALLERSMADTQRRIDRERAQVRMLARTLYVQPDSLVALIFESASVAEALTRVADLTSAGDRAAAMKHALDEDLGRLSQQRGQLQSDRDRTRELEKQLQSQFSKLVSQIAASRYPAPSQRPLSLDPGSVGAIQQIILDAFAPLGSTAQSWALRVAKCESNYNPYAVNSGSGAAGLFQFLPSTWRSSPYASYSPFDPKANAEAAAWLYQRSGPGQWSCK